MSEAPIHVDPEKTQLRALPRHIIAFTIAVAAATGFALDLRAEVGRLNARFDGLGDSPGLSGRVTRVETETEGTKATVQSLANEIKALRGELETQRVRDQTDRDRFAVVLGLLEKRLGVRPR